MADENTSVYIIIYLDVILCMPVEENSTSYN